MIAFDDLRKILLLENVSDSMLEKMVPLLEMRVFRRTGHYISAG